MHKTLMGWPIVLMVAVGCSTTGKNYQPIVDYDASRKDAEQYRADMARCREYASQVRADQEAVEGAGVGAAVGAVAGLALGAALGNGDISTAAAAGATGGALVGGVGAGSNAVADQETVIKRCMVNRGWVLLR